MIVMIYTAVPFVTFAIKPYAYKKGYFLVLNFNPLQTDDSYTRHGSVHFFYKPIRIYMYMDYYFLLT